MGLEFLLGDRDDVCLVVLDGGFEPGEIDLFNFLTVLVTVFALSSTPFDHPVKVVVFLFLFHKPFNLS